MNVTDIGFVLGRMRKALRAGNRERARRILSAYVHREFLPVTWEFDRNPSRHRKLAQARAEYRARIPGSYLVAGIGEATLLSAVSAQGQIRARARRRINAARRAVILEREGASAAV